MPASAKPPSGNAGSSEPVEWAVAGTRKGNIAVSSPNIIWVFADQMRGQAMSCAGDPNASTPNLDRLAAQGVRCTAACSTYPVCVPFRFTLLTGEYAHTRWIPALDWRMSPAERTIAHEFNDAGYHTVYFGKWHLNGSIPPGDARGINRTPVLPGFRGGFREWHGFNLRNDYFDTCCFHGDDSTPRPLGKYQTDGLFDLALDWLENRADDAAPFFMVLSVEAPHPPHDAPKAYLERVRRRGIRPRANCRFTPPDDGLDYPPACRIREEHFERRSIGYYAQIENLDDNMGRLLDALERTGRFEDTVLFFFSDHGEFLGSHGLVSKQDPREESINIPFLVYGPCRGLAGGRALHDPICTEDIYPTTLAAAGISPPSRKPGLDLLPSLRGQVDALPREGVYLEFVEEHRPNMIFYRRPWRGFRTRRWKYTMLDSRPWHLFDLENDPYEQQNLVGRPETADVQRRLEEELRRIARESADSFLFDRERPA